MKEKILNIVGSKKFGRCYAIIAGATIGGILWRMGYSQGELDVSVRLRSIMESAVESAKKIIQENQEEETE